MGLLNTPPVSPQEPDCNQSDEEVEHNEDDFEVIEVYDEEIEQDQADGEAEEDDDGDMAEENIPDDALMAFKQHSGKNFQCFYLITY